MTRLRPHTLLFTYINIFSLNVTSGLDEIVGAHRHGFQCNISTSDQVPFICHISEVKLKYAGIVHRSFRDLKNVPEVIVIVCCH